MSDEVIAALLLVTLGMAIWCLWSCVGIHRIYREAVRSDEVVLSHHFAMLIGIVAVVMAGVAGWSLVRLTFPELDLGGLPAALTTTAIIVAVNLLFLVPIGVHRVWRRWRAEGRLRVDEP